VGNVEWVCEGVVDRGRGVRIVLVLVISMVTLHSAALIGRGSDGVGHVGGILNTILVGVEGRTRIGWAIVDSAVRVGVWWGRECVKVCSTHSRRVASVVRGLVLYVVATANSSMAKVLLEIFFIIREMRFATSFQNCSKGHGASESANNPKNAKSHTDGSFVREKALGDSTSRRAGENSRR
jgi:hypothetical protein